MLNNLSIFEAKQPMSFGRNFKIAAAAVGIVAAAVEYIIYIGGKKKKKEKCSILV